MIKSQQEFLMELFMVVNVQNKIHMSNISWSMQLFLTPFPVKGILKTRSPREDLGSDKELDLGSDRVLDLGSDRQLDLGIR